MCLLITNRTIAAYLEDIQNMAQDKHHFRFVQRSKIWLINSTANQIAKQTRVSGQMYVIILWVS